MTVDFTDGLTKMDKHLQSHRAHPASAPCPSGLCEERGRELAEGTTLDGVNMFEEGL